MMRFIFQWYILWWDFVLALPDSPLVGGVWAWDKCWCGLQYEVSNEQTTSRLSSQVEMLQFQPLHAMQLLWNFKMIHNHLPGILKIRLLRGVCSSGWALSHSVFCFIIFFHLLSLSSSEAISLQLDQASKDKV